MSENTPLIYSKIAAIIDDLGAISKDKTNVEQKFKYRGIDQFYNALHPLFAKHGVFSVPNILERTEEPHTTKSGTVWRHVVIKVRYDFFASDGSKFESTVFGESLDGGDKATNKALAIAHKYCLLQVFCVATEDMEDPDEKTAPESIPERVKAQATKTAADPFFDKCDAAKKWLTAQKAPDAFNDMLGFYGFERIEELPADKREEFLSRIKQIMQTIKDQQLQKIAAEELGRAGNGHNADKELGF